LLCLCVSLAWPWCEKQLLAISSFVAVFPLAIFTACPQRSMASTDDPHSGLMASPAGSSHEYDMVDDFPQERRLTRRDSFASVSSSFSASSRRGITTGTLIGQSFPYAVTSILQSNGKFLRFEPENGVFWPVPSHKFSVVVILIQLGDFHHHLVHTDVCLM
jgi:hypothetical protein